jgi:hypothetical protein
MPSSTCRHVTASFTSKCGNHASNDEVSKPWHDCRCTGEQKRQTGPTLMRATCVSGRTSPFMGEGGKNAGKAGSIRALQRTSRMCSSKLRSGFVCGGASRSHTLMVPSPQADSRMFSLPSLQQQSYTPSIVSKATSSTTPCGVTCAAIVKKVGKESLTLVGLPR